MLDGDHKALVDAALPVCARYGLAVAGGYAVKAHGLVTRPSEDIDFATGTAAPMEEIVAALAAALDKDFSSPLPQRTQTRPSPVTVPGRSSSSR